MKVISHKLDSNGKPIQLMPLSDLHLGDAHCDKKLIRACIDTIKNTENLYCILDGDLMNTAIAGSKSDFYGETLTPMEQLETCIELFQPLVDQGKILAVLSGNHEERISKAVGVDMSKFMAVQLGLGDVYSSTSTVMFLRFGHCTNHDLKRSQNYSVYINHGNGGGGRRPGGKINAMEDMAKIITADVYVMGHTHMPSTFRNQHLLCNPSNHTVTLREQVFVNTASFLNWSGSYGDRMGFQPNSKQPPIITFADTEHHITVTL